MRGQYIQLDDDQGDDRSSNGCVHGRLPRTLRRTNVSRDDSFAAPGHAGIDGVAGASCLLVLLLILVAHVKRARLRDFFLPLVLAHAKPMQAVT